ncbi:MAG: translation elongation factor-like protein [Candidatus Aenigmarchaeota archaeon]|nr:translation elongation factor-like protein [Candidatus Aenigmarchaeota archaeon]
MQEEEVKKQLVGTIAHYYGKIGVGVVDLVDTLKVGDEILIQGNVTNLRQKVESMEIEHKQVESATKGQSIGLKTVDRVREGDQVFKILE